MQEPRAGELGRDLADDGLDDSLEQNDFRSSREDMRASHYTVLGRVLGEHSLVTNFDRKWGSLGDDFVRAMREKATLARLADLAGLPAAVAAEAARLYDELRAAGAPLLRSSNGSRAPALRVALLIAAARRAGLPVTRRTWDEVAAAALGLPSGGLTAREEAEVRRLRGEAFKVLNRLARLGLNLGRAAEPLEAVPDPQMRFHALRLLRELREAGVPINSGARLAALYLASLAINRPLGGAELARAAKEAFGASRATQAAAEEALSRVVVRVTVGPGSPPLASAVARLPAYPRPSAGGELVARLRVRCAACGYEWDVEARAPSTGSFKLGAVASTIAYLGSCPRCGARLERVASLDVLPLRGLNPSSQQRKALNVRSWLAAPAEGRPGGPRGDGSDAPSPAGLASVDGRAVPLPSTGPHEPTGIPKSLWARAKSPRPTMNEREVSGVRAQGQTADNAPAPAGASGG